VTRNFFSERKDAKANNHLQVLMEQNSILANRKVLFIGSAVIAFCTLIMLLGFVGGTELHRAVLELNSPEVLFDKVPAGLGVMPSKIDIRVVDTGSGLEWVAVDLVQNQKSTPLLSKVLLGGAASQTINIVIPGTETTLREGKINLIATAMDRSLFRNRKVAEVSLLVDLQKPKIELISYEKDLLQGSSQLLFVRAYDNSNRVDITLRIGTTRFKSYPAKAIDRIFDDPNLYVIPFVVPIDEKLGGVVPTLYVEDPVGNGTKLRVYAMNIVARSSVKEDIDPAERYSQEYIRAKVVENESSLQEFFEMLGDRFSFVSPENSEQRSLEYFRLFTEYLVPMQERVFHKITQNLRFDRYWFKPMAKPGGRVISRFATAGSNREGSSLPERLSKGYMFSLLRSEQGVYATSEGIVVYSGNCGYLGRCVAIDHGLGLVSLFGILESVSVRIGESVATGTLLGTAEVESSGRSRKYYFELSVQGEAVEPRDWWSEEWFAEHITGATNRARRDLGLPAELDSTMSRTLR
jgi:murein DD-endopeptidase MepM/ murein hydrolase activator NlpD